MVIKQLEDRIQPLIVPAVLETDTGLASQAVGMGAGHRSRTALQKPLEMLTQELDTMHAQLCSFGVDPEVISQVVRQLFYYLCAGALNNFLLRRDLCNWAKGLQIRYNVSVLEEWSRNKKLGSKEVLETLNPIIQATQLLQSRKTDSDVPGFHEMCSTLTIPQVVKLLNLYTSDDYENKLTPTFIAKVKTHLISTRKEEDTTNVFMDTKYSFAVKFPFNPSSIRLEDLDVPEPFGLTGIVKRV